MVIDFVVHLTPGGANLLGIDDDDKVASFDARVEIRLLLTEQDAGDLSRQTAQVLVISVYQDPRLIDLIRFWDVCLLHVHPLQNIYSVLLRSRGRASPQIVLLLISFTCQSLWRIVHFNQGQALRGR